MEYVVADRDADTPGSGDDFERSSLQSVGPGPMRLSSGLDIEGDSMSKRHDALRQVMLWPGDDEYECGLLAGPPSPELLTGAPVARSARWMAGLRSMTLRHRAPVPTAWDPLVLVEAPRATSADVDPPARAAA